MSQLIWTPPGISPTPWNAYKGFVISGAPVGRDHKGDVCFRTIAVLQGQVMDTFKPDRALIAAAPDLYNAAAVLENLLTYLTAPEREDLRTPHGLDLSREYATVKIALEKARKL